HSPLPSEPCEPVIPAHGSSKLQCNNCLLLLRDTCSRHAVNLVVAVQMYEPSIFVVVRSTLCPWRPVIEMKVFSIEELPLAVHTDIPLSARDSSRLGCKVTSLRLLPVRPIRAEARVVWRCQTFHHLVSLHGEPREFQQVATRRFVTKYPLVVS